MNSFFKFLFIILFNFTLLFSTELKKVDLQLQWKYQFQFAGFIMAKEKGFYKDIGLDVNIKEWNPSINMVDELINQNVNYALVRPTSLIDIAKGKELLYLGAIYQSSPLVVLTDKSSGIKTLKDFDNKRLMSTGDLNSDASLIAMMFSQGVDIKSIKMQKPSFNPKDLLDKNTDLMSSYISNEPFVLKELGGNPVIFNPSDYGFEFYNDILSTTKDYYKENKNEVIAFKNASIKGWEYAFSNINETVDLIFNKYNSLNKSKKALLYEANELKKLAYYNTDTIGKIEQVRLEKIYDTYKLLGLIQKSIDINNYILKDKTIVLSSIEKAYLNTKKEISMCVDPNWMPFEKIENGKHIGLTAEYFKHFSKVLSTKFTLYPTKTWSQTLEAAKQRKCDIISLAMSTPNRKEYLNFTSPYIKSPLVAVTKLNVPFINDISNLKNKKVAIPKGYAFVEILKNKYPYLTLVEVEDVDEGLDVVSDGKVFAYIGTLASIEYKFQKRYFDELKIAGKFNEVWQLGIGVRNDDKLLLNILEKTIHTLDTQDKEEILENWKTVSYQKNVDYDLVIKILIVLLIIISFFAYKQYLLNKSIKDFNELINATLEGILVSENGICIGANKSATDMFNYDSIEQLKGKYLFDFVAEESRGLLKEKLTIDETEPYEIMALRKDGTKFNALVRGQQLKRKNLRVSNIIDISLLKNQEKLLIEQSKMMALGEMLSNIAHQWRQPLAAISASSTGMKLQKEHGILTDTQFFGACDTINNYSQYLSKTIDDFKNYAKGDTKPLKYNLKEDTQSFLILVESFIKKYNLDINLISEDDIDIYGYPNQLIQCFINLFYNSNDALQKLDHNQRYIEILQIKANKNAIIKFRDNGGGINPEIMPKIFEPYFTTKHKSQGTGLGLHMTYNLIVNSMNGSIEVQNIDIDYKNKKYSGIEFTITLPLNS